MTTCPACGVENPPDHKFCGQCGAPLAAPVAIAEERKVVTTLICDLVGFTAMSEAADPEDVDRLLGEYSERARKVIESHSGTVEKFIGDAVVGVFGVPAVHEDDPERAVRAGLRIIEALEGMTRPDGSRLQARIGINTGEALVRLDVDPASGRGFLTGDAVNVAARLEAAAPPGGVVVGKLTHQLTERVIVYEELASVRAKGKVEPVTAWLAAGTLARRGLELRTTDLTPLVGREAELTYLSAIFDKAMRQSSPQFALIVGEPGIGKSRLVRELSALVDASPQMTTWRQGYCPPFGEDITYGALAEIVKGHAGIRDNDPREAVESKLDAILPAGPDRGWFRQRLGALLGLEALEASREENFAAWMRFFEGVANVEPAVLVFEDLHWANESLLDFLEHLATQVAAVPLLLLGTARPELFERKPGFASAGPVTRVNLGPLSPSESAQLVVSLLGEPDDHASAVAQVVERCEGNPFYAEQSARLLVDTSLQTSLPDSIQAVIAARLDALPADEKRLLGDASIVGAVFWHGALQALSDRQAEELERSLSGLLQHQLVRRLREPSMEGEQEFTFVHALAREVAYGQLPRLERARRHRVVAEWIASRTADRADEFAELVAYHYVTALDYFQMADEKEVEDEVRNRAIDALLVAARRARALDGVAAERHFARALQLMPEGDPRRPWLLAEWAVAVEELGDHARSAPALERAADELERQGKETLAAYALAWLGAVDQALGRDPSIYDDKMLGLIEGEPASEEMIFVLQAVATSDVNRGRPERAREHAERALATADALGHAPSANDFVLGALIMRGTALCELGDPGGLDYMRKPVEAAVAEGTALRWVNNYALAVFCLNGPASAIPLLEQYVTLYGHRGLRWYETWTRALLWLARLDSGGWEMALESFRQLEKELGAAGEVGLLLEVRTALAQALARRGEWEAAESAIAGCLPMARATGMPGITAAVLSAVAEVEVEKDRDCAVRCLAELPGVLDGSFAFFSIYMMPATVRLALLVGAFAVAADLCAWIPVGLPSQQLARTHADAMMAEVRDEREQAVSLFADAATRWHGFGVPYEEGQALLAQGRCLVALGRPAEATRPLEQAREIFEPLGAKPALTEVEGLLQQAAVSVD